MNISLVKLLGVALACGACVFTFALRAQEKSEEPPAPFIEPPPPPSPPETPEEQAEKKESQEQVPRDPFSVTETIRRRAAQDAPQQRGAATAIPSLRLMGYGDDGRRPPLALLQVDGSDVLLVRENDLFHLSGRGGSTEIRIRSVSETGVVLEVGPEELEIVVR